MAGRFFGKIGICIMILMIIVSMASGATISVGNGDSNDANSLDIGLLMADNGDTILLDNINGTINSTFTAGNITIIDKDLFIDFSAGSDSLATVRLNNSIQFKDSKRINFTNTDQVLNLWYDPATGGSFINNTLVQFLGSTDLFNSTTKADSTMIINTTTPFAGTAMNVTSSNNGINLNEAHGTFTGHITGDSKLGVNISGNNNYIRFQAGNGGDINATDIAINLVGKDNHIIMDSDNIVGRLGRLYICQGATGNYIHDYLGSIGFPSYSIYNGSAYSSSSKWGYFYNNTWSRGGNMNVTISVRNLPYGGNVSVKALFGNVTGASGDNVFNTTLTVNSSSVFGGLVHNLTESTKFTGITSEVPVKYTLGGNTLYADWLSTAYVNEYSIGPVRIINFNPVNSITTMSMNSTYTTNWTAYSAAQFAAAQPSFVVDNGTVDYKLLGNLTFAENIDLLDLTTINQLQQLGNSITVTNCSIFLDSTVLTQFDKKAVLTMYPAFPFTTTANLVLKVTPDGGAETTLWDGTAYTAQSPTYLTTDTIEVNTTVNSTRIWTTGFSKFTFSQYTAPPTPAPAGGGTTVAASSSGGSSTNDISVKVVSNLKSGQTAGFDISRSAIFEISATVNTDVPKMMVTVEKKSPSRGIEDAPVDVYEYDQVNMYWADDSEISKATIEFKVSKNWLSQNGYSFNDIVMLRYNEESKQWEQLPTEFIGEENDNYLYRATTSGFSWFAVGYEKDATIVSEEKSTKEIEIVAEEESPENLDMLKNGAEETEIPAETETPATPLGAAPFAALIFAGIVLFLKRR